MKTKITTEEVFDMCICIVFMLVIGYVLSEPFLKAIE